MQHPPCHFSRSGHLSSVGKRAGNARLRGCNVAAQGVFQEKDLPSVADGLPLGSIPAQGKKEEPPSAPSSIGNILHERMLLPPGARRGRPPVIRVQDSSAHICLEVQSACSTCRFVSLSFAARILHADGIPWIILVSFSITITSAVRSGELARTSSLIHLSS